MQKTLNDIIKSAQKLGYDIDTRPYALNLIGVRNSAATDQQKFDDLIAYFYYDENRRLVGKVAAATTDPATYFLVNPMNPKGAAILKSGQYKDSWGLGLHKGQYTALVQTKPLPVIRDNDRNALINYFAPTTTGLYGINIHRASRGKNNVAVIGKDSAGCQVFRDENDYDNMIKFAKTSRDKYGNKFSYTLIDERDTIKLRNTALLIAGIGILGFAAYLYFKKNK